VKPELPAQPILNQRGKILQPFGTLVYYQLGLTDKAKKQSVDALNQILADTIQLRDMYKKSHWQVSGPTFYQLHLLFEQHYKMQAAITDLLAERVQTLGGVSLAVPQDVAEVTRIERSPKGREQVPEQLSRLLEAHEKIIVATRAAARLADENDDLGTNDLLMSDVLRPNEKQVWFLSEHLVNGPEVIAK
jgi:starvation-inducible DNA-binding protein